MKTFLREPLVHFLLLGVGLFLAYGALNRKVADTDPQTIVIERDKLLTYLQYRSRAFDGERFNEVLDTLSRQELQQLVDNYVREEALYREAKALQLDKNDYVARLRLIQQLEFITRGFADVQVELTEREIEHYYDTHKTDYSERPKVTFTHIFFNRERHGIEEAGTLAQAELRRLNEDQVNFEQAPAHGDRFLYHLNYVAREPDEVTSHFGAAMQQALFALEPSNTTWQGPFQSPYGFHLVLLTGNQRGYIPPLEEVREQVVQDARRKVLDDRFEQSVQAIVGAYDVQVRPDIQRNPES